MGLKFFIFLLNFFLIFFFFSSTFFFLFFFFFFLPYVCIFSCSFFKNWIIRFGIKLNYHEEIILLLGSKTKFSGLFWFGTSRFHKKPSKCVNAISHSS